jgi:hypothetical protein
MDDDEVKPKSTLEELASKRFSDLSKAELKLLRVAPQGLLAHCGDPAAGREQPVNDPRHADTWSKEQNIRSELIQWLCVEPQAESRVDPKGISVRSARITGELDLSFVVVRFHSLFSLANLLDPYLSSWRTCLYLT